MGNWLRQSPIFPTTYRYAGQLLSIVIVLHFHESVVTETPDTTPEDDIPTPVRPSRFFGKLRSGSALTSARHGFAISSWMSRVAPARCKAPAKKLETTRAMISTDYGNGPTIAIRNAGELLVERLIYHAPT